MTTTQRTGLKDENEFAEGIDEAKLSRVIHVPKFVIRINGIIYSSSKQLLKS